MTRKEKIEFIKNYQPPKPYYDYSAMTTEELLRLKDLCNRVFAGRTQAEIDAALTQEEKQFLQYIDDRYLITN